MLAQIRRDMATMNANDFMNDEILQYLEEILFS
jgi:hypothetical protein